MFCWERPMKWLCKRLCPVAEHPIGWGQIDPIISSFLIRADEGEAPRAVLLSSEPPSSTLSSLFLPYITANLASSSSVTEKGNQKQTQAEIKKRSKAKQQEKLGFCCPYDTGSFMSVGEVVKKFFQNENSITIRSNYEGGAIKRKGKLWNSHEKMGALIKGA
ncbi:Sodium channel protein type 8 subunit alpha [Manis javanica]|nr:Sodium channel protein type 8 subunit alpha [Manis javanica]